jgi:vancomycin resistance protein YoaR
LAEHRRLTALPDVGNRAKLVVGGALALLVVIYIALIVLSGGGVRQGSVVSGVTIGGLSSAEAVASLDATLGKASRKPFKLEAAGKEFVVKPRDAGLAFDAQATVESASGRSWNPFTLAADLLGQREVEPVVVVDEPALTSQLAGISLAIDRPAIEPSITIERQEAKLKPGKNGRALDVEATSAQLIEALLEPREPIAAPIAKVLPLISGESADESMALARTAMDNPIIVNAGAASAKLRPKAISRALSFTAAGGQLEPRIDGEVLQRALDGKLKGAEVPGRDASFKIVGGKPVVVPSIVGKGVSDVELATAVVGVLGDDSPARNVTVSMAIREPAVTTEQARALGVTERLSTFTQKFPYAAYRVQNIGQAARNVNGTLLLPGQTFSMNDAMKERTEKNGYTVGFVVGAGGVFAEDLGGGVSAATTTVWTGAFFAGLERVSTQAHSIYISRYQPGLEATVAWGMFDMKFKNNMPTGVFITTQMTNTSMTVTFWGTRIYDDIKAEFGPRKDIVPFTTIFDKSKTCLGQSGMEGFTIAVDRVFFRGGVEVKRETITTNYRPAPEVVCGKKPKPGEEPVDTSNGKPSDAKTPKPVVTPGADTAPAAAATPSPTPQSTKKPKPTPPPVEDAAPAPGR